MANVRDIRKRIRSVKNTQQITRAMKMVAAAKLRRAQETALASRPYARKMEEVLNSIAARADVSANPLFRKNDSNRVVVVVVTADRGLAGGFNNNLCKVAVEVVARLRGEGRDVVLYPVGKKGRDYFRNRAYPTLKERVNVFAKLAFGHAKLLAEELTQIYLDGEVGEVVVVYNEFKSVMAPRMRSETLLPIPRLAPAAPASLPAAPLGLVSADYEYEPDPETILAALVPFHLHTQVWRVLLESSAAEHAARMTAMESASKNAGEMIESLTLTMNKVRQAAITKELIEVVSGAQAAMQ